MKLKPQGTYVGDGSVWKIRSNSDPFTWYFTVLIPSAIGSDSEFDEVVCSCKGFQNAKKCWHVDAVRNGDWDDTL
jgi:hypothetical protein